MVKNQVGRPAAKTDFLTELISKRLQGAEIQQDIAFFSGIQGKC
ncbi:hypothetical protein [Psychromonas ingrahamii]|nr:hypothetical protein [Psychromonas ingrahamii]